MLPDDIEYYINNSVGLEIHHFGDDKRYWIKGGVGYLEFPEDSFKDLIDILRAYDEEVLRPPSDQEG